ncbi:MAG: cobyrinic acid ac-diamide synthase [Halanaerobium sp. 4-GBenrich]|uniref:MinD superfamily P-loop ATPase n=1 Tax=Halanaerobium congolense TaxID=54121 RepID=A0A1G6RYN8_9FIRM|nr:ATP-binding protein [Halanaerobium congolense]KXS50132.1 MAG: cobyrinic acid ac-diamide synthase [Halanaerobium sp. T82-1]ODS50417.1 MAG: cobyrinic acid ac-diamide synthase [Halanaerobium sp. 4-GBenrich]PUU92631.1 MAG: cobyrinic acid ac-diamide synthase [Halanaerobium sp.]PTX17885.1 MinD superfamily P-loop ATPase [Halanaerobium congolense]PXV67951.1 MinD superfamily P-loop ATPase [Halanaerobium congolense]
MNKEISLSILSGKGGTGKTTLAVNLALALENVQLLDADVEEPNDYIFISPEIEKREVESVMRLIPEVNDDLCTACRKCVDFCEYNALAMMLDNVLVFEEVCHSCGGCKIVCPENAITEKEKELGKIRHHQLDNLDFWQGELNTGEEKAVPVIEKLKSKIDHSKKTIIDSPPGTTCPTIEAITDTNFTVVVTEPSAFGLHDLKMVVEMLKQIDQPFAVIINRAEADSDYLIEKYCQQKEIKVLLKIPFSRKIAELYSNGIPFVNQIEGWESKFKGLYQKILEEAGKYERNNSN